MRSRVLPHPILSVVVAVVWVALANDLSAASLVFGIVLGIGVPLFTACYWPERPIVKRPLVMLEYAAVVAWDIVVSNIEVARLILFRRGSTLRSLFVTVPLELTTPEAVTVLTGTITMTPGTVSADLSADGRSVLVHCLDAGDPDAVVRQIKTRYERRLKEIFE
ncbi:Na+/H+ antiporter subunit E [Rhodoplanes sp. TEM]|uniref:Na+/H+ antiporter subunit E n=1 Tax=Rhodoplanes tepidamans TaxID=200616 RepID=A0ABT5JIL0_RHOTP|nr:MULTISPECIES: Na+/H+ antiporter subunit E [Rhodoplanes]MDC7789535.1 Na+/H+ antiporter subunit E [Rhodoplanes tepidamans]MDC7987731.1 Na+/H+ antiporter subunit E [Rhodoplanes sp. TEM]MDQ0354001.1 multicomponent K+:H+ antiporter subunit E [Rhodoplanes tepidamans]